MASLAVKYRPNTFKEVQGQSSIIRILQRQLQLKEIKNSYLFCGPSGCGKTTLARIFANNINNGVGLPIEIDAASNNGVENVRQIVDTAGERSLTGEYKIYIVDECHQFTNAAWQALLKTIEEPPKYTIFIFCTTDPQKVPQTIINRCMRFNFTRLSSDEIYQRLIYICQQEQFDNYQETCDYISKICNGQMRDGIAYLEKVASYDNNLSYDNAVNALGNYSYQLYFDLTDFIKNNTEDRMLSLVNYVYNSGGDLKLFIDQYLVFVIDLMKYVLMKDLSITHIPSTASGLATEFTYFSNSDKFYSSLMEQILELKNEIKNDVDIKTTIEVNLLKISRSFKVEE